VTIIYVEAFFWRFERDLRYPGASSYFVCEERTTGEGFGMGGRFKLKRGVKKRSILSR